MNPFRDFFETAALVIALEAVILIAVETLNPILHFEIPTFLAVGVYVVFMTGLTSLLLRWVS